MWLRSILGSFNPRRSRAVRGRHAVAARLQLEAFEDRSLPSYVVTDLGTLGGYSRAEDVNTSGQVAGTSAISAEWNHAFVWTAGALIDLGTLGGAWSSASALNDRGQVVGVSATPDGVGHAFLLTPEDTNGDGSPDRWFRDGDGDGANDLMTALQLPPGATVSRALDVNNAGAVVGDAVDAAGHAHALLWTAAGVTDLGTFGGEETVPTGINDAGQVVGRAQDAAGQFHAFLWDGAHGMTDLGYSEAWASGISPSGLVAGHTFDPATGATIGFVWTPDQPNGVTGTMTTLAPPMLGGYVNPESSAARDVNDAGVVIGYSTYYVLPDPWSPYYPNGGYYTTHATVWKNGVGEDLGEKDVNRINAAGRIAGAQYYEGESRAVLLTPEPDPPPALSIGNVSIVEGHSGTASAVFTVRLSAASDQTVTVGFATAGGTAAAGNDYLPASGTLTFAPGETTKTITVPVNGDRVGEPHETFVVNLSGATNATLADGQVVGTILDDEPRISIGDVSKKEGKKNQTTLFTFTVTLSAAYDQPVTMSFRTADGTATTGDGDYLARTGTLTFAPGETTKTITIEVKGDGKREANEYFYLDLFDNSSNSLVTKKRGTGTILNDD